MRTRRVEADKCLKVLSRSVAASIAGCVAATLIMLEKKFCPSLSCLHWAGPTASAKSSCPHCQHSLPSTSTHREGVGTARRGRQRTSVNTQKRRELTSLWAAWELCCRASAQQVAQIYAWLEVHRISVWTYWITCFNLKHVIKCYLNWNDFLLSVSSLSIQHNPVSSTPVTTYFISLRIFQPSSNSAHPVLWGSLYLTVQNGAGVQQQLCPQQVAAW